MKNYLAIFISIVLTGCSGIGKNHDNHGCYSPSYSSEEIKGNSQINHGGAIRLTRFSPYYPREMINKGLSGNVQLIFDVSPEGNTNNSRILYSTHPQFSKAILTALSCWKFKPSENGFLKQQIEYEFILK